MKEITLPTIQARIEEKASVKFNAWFDELRNQWQKLLVERKIQEYDFQLVIRATDDDKITHPYIGQLFGSEGVLKAKMKQVYLPKFVKEEIELLLKDRNV